MKVSTAVALLERMVKSYTALSSFHNSQGDHEKADYYRDRAERAQLALDEFRSG